MISKEPTHVEKQVLAAFQADDTSAVDATGAEISGDFLRGLFLGEYDERADYRGTCITNAVINDVLDMEFCEIKFPVRFHNCSFVREIKIQQLSCPELDFRGCSLMGGFNAQMVKVAGGVDMQEVDATDAVNFDGAEIGGQFSCVGGSFLRKGKIALNAQNIKVVTDVFLRSVKAEGTVYLVGAEIGGQLDCTGGNFWNEEGRAFNAQSIKVAGDMFLHHGFVAKGMVWLSGAEIGAQLDCTGGSFQNKGEVAINAQNIKVAGSMFLRDEFNVVGEVSLLGAEIEGQLVCSGGSFQNDKGNALVAQSIKVASDVFLISHKLEEEKRVENFSANGKASFVNATIEGDLELKGCKLTHLSLAGANVSGAFLDDADVYKNQDGNDIVLDIDGFRYQRLDAAKERIENRLAWIGSMSKGDKFYPQPYEQLMKVYREMGHMNWARRVGFALEKKRHKQLRLNRDHKRFVVLGWAWWLWYWILRGTIGYGYKPFRAVMCWLAPLILAGFVLFGGTLPLSCPDPCRAGSEACHCMAPSDAEVLLSDDWKIHGKLPRDYPDFNPVYYAVETALPVLPLGQTENWHPKTPWFRWAQGLITIIGALVLTILASYGVGVLGPRWKDE